MKVNLTSIQSGPLLFCDVIFEPIKPLFSFSFEFNNLICNACMHVFESTNCIFIKWCLFVKKKTSSSSQF